MKYCLCSHIVTLVGLLMIAFAPFSSIGAQAIDSQVQEHFLAAQRFQRQDQLAAAIREYKAVLHLAPRLPEASVNLGLIYYAQADYLDSAKMLARAQELKPKMRGVSLWLGVDYVKLNQPARAVPLLREAVLLDPTDKQAQTWLGTALWDDGNKIAAIDQLTKAHSLFPKDLDICFVLGEAYRKAANEKAEATLAASSGKPLLNQIYGDIYQEQRMWPKAIAHYELAIKQDPHWKGAHLEIGRIDLAEQKLAQAQMEFSGELAVDPSSARAYALLGETAILQGDIPKVLQMLDRAIAISPEKSAAALGISPRPAMQDSKLSDGQTEVLRRAETALQHVGESPSRSLALAYIAEALGTGDFDPYFRNFLLGAKEPSAPADRKQRAILASDRGQFAEAETNLQVWLRTHPHDLQAQYLLAQIYRNRSLQVLDELMRLDPDSYHSHELLAQTYENRDDNDKALAEYRIVEKLAPALPGIHFEIGHLLGQESHPAEALEELHEELQLDPYHPEANGEIGTILVNEHEPAEAIPYLKTALRIRSDLWTVHEELGRAYMLQKDYPKAEGEFLKATEHDPDGSARYQLALVYRAEGRMTAAAKEFAEVRKIKEGRPDPSDAKAQEADAQ